MAVMVTSSFAVAYVKVEVAVVCPKVTVMGAVVAVSLLKSPVITTIS